MQAEKREGCSCCELSLGPHVDRRRLVQLAGAAGLAIALRPAFSWAAEGDYEAMVLYCIDPRVPEITRNYLVEHGLAGNRGHLVVIAHR